MILKILVMLCFSALVSAGVIGTDFSPASSVSYSSISTPTLVKTISSPIGYTKIVQTPPAYESVLTTKESKFESPDGTQHTSYTKSFDTAYSSLKKFESKSSKDGEVLANTIPGIYSTSVYSPIVHHPQTAYAYSSPLIHAINAPIFSKSVSVPITYSSHEGHLTKTIASPSITSYASPVLTKSKIVTSGLSSYSTPFEHTISSPSFTKSATLPVTYTTHTLPLTKTFVSPAITSYSTPIVSKSEVLTSGLSTYPSHTALIESQPIKTTLTYSEAPVVSHMSFNGLGASYAW